MTPDYVHASDRCTIRFFNCDCKNYLKECGDKSKSLAVVDPPYNISVNMNAGRKIGQKSKKRTIKKWDSIPPDKEYFDNIFRTTENQIIFGANYFTKFLPASAGWIFWDKCVAPDCSFSDGELAWTSFNRSLKKLVVPWSGFIGMEGEKFHPTTKPIKLYRSVLQNYAKPGDTIIDTHGGSMSLAISCEIEGFDLDICELDKEYFDKALNRFKIHVSQKRLF